jgi:L-fucose isomerase-like protein
VKEDEASFKARAEAQKTDIEDLRKQLAEAKENCALAQTNQEISEYWKIIWRKMLKNFTHPKKGV